MPKKSKYMGRSATIPTPFNEVTIIDTERPVPLAGVRRSSLTPMVTRLCGGTVCTKVCAVPPVNRYSTCTCAVCWVSGFSRVKNSLKLPPTYPSAKYHSLLTGTLLIPGGGVGVEVPDTPKANREPSSFPTYRLPLTIVAVPAKNEPADVSLKVKICLPVAASTATSWVPAPTTTNPGTAMTELTTAPPAIDRCSPTCHIQSAPVPATG